MKKLLFSMLFIILIAMGCENDKKPDKKTIDNAQQVIEIEETIIGQVTNLTEDNIFIDANNQEFVFKNETNKKIEIGQTLEVTYSKQGEQRTVNFTVIKEKEVSFPESEQKIKGMFMGQGDSRSVEIESDNVVDIYIITEQMAEIVSTLEFEQPIYYTFTEDENGQKIITSIVAN